MAVPKAKPSDGLTPDQWARVQEIFHAALDHETAARAVFLDQACAAEPGLRLEVDSLLAAEEPACGFLASFTDGLIEILHTASATQPAEPAEFPGSERFELRRELGTGGFGTVYEAYDQERQTAVALKTMHRAGASEIYYFKREFRSLADFDHPNLVALYELLSDGGHWFFTMEMVAGSHFLEYVSGAASQAEWTKLRAAMVQLAAGVNALHDSGRLHRDLKPSNVLVTNEGRVVIVDFGLIADAELEELRGPLSGTPAYMAPEQLQTGRASTATDWYSVGVMLFQALTTRLPSRKEPVSWPSDRSLPRDLVELCEALLRRDAGQRPSGQDVLRLLDATGVVGGSLLPEGPLLGRDQEIDSLAKALQSVSCGDARVVTVTGSSGMGKTALVQQFLDQVRREGGFLTLAGRCYEQESVPYKGLDEIVDALAAYLQSLPISERNALLDHDTALAARLFSVLEAFTPSIHSDKIDTRELQQAAYSSFRTLLKRVSERRPLLLYIDDLHWSNTDSLQLLTQILRPPSPPAMLLIVSYPSDSEHEGNPTGPLKAWQRGLADLCPITEIHLGQLAPLEANKLAAMLLPDLPNREKLAARLAQESGGNPFLLGELAQHAQSWSVSETDSAVCVEEMLRSRVALLPDAARRLLEVVAVAGQPVESQIAWTVAQCEGAQQTALGVLRARRFIRMRRVKDRQEIEPYHDRVRQTVEHGLTPESREQRHLHLGVELEACGRASPESLAVHFHEGRDKAKAFRYSIAAAESASRALAFDRAVHWYELALSERKDREARVKLADALSSSGRGREAADIYLDCVDGAGSVDQLELRRKAATELLISGHLEEGQKALKGVLAAIGMKLPRTAIHAIPLLLLNRTRIRMRGLGLRVRPSGSITARELQRADACWSVTRGLAMVDTIRTAEFHSRNLLLTLSLGDKYRASRALSVEAGYSALSGSKTHSRTQEILGLAVQLSEACDNPHALGLTRLVNGMAAFLEGRWEAARDSLQGAETFLRERCAGVAWELATARFMHCTALYFLGEIKNLSARLPLLLENAKARGDLYESTHLRIRVAHVLYLARDRADIAQGELNDAIEQRPAGAFYLEHWWAMIAGLEIAIYRGDIAGAWRLVTSKWGALRRSLLMGIQYVRIESFLYRALAALALARDSPAQQRRLVRGALLDAVRIEREHASWAMPLCGLIRAGAAEVDGRAHEALLLLVSAEDSLNNVNMHLLAAAARRRRGELIAGDEGRSLVADADAWMIAQDVSNPERMAALLAPGSC